MKTNVIIVLTTLLFVSNIHSQSKLTESKKIEIGEITKELKVSNNSFGFNLFTELFPQYDNIIISPFNIYSTLLLANAGSENETEKEFEKLMLFNNNKMDYYKKHKFIVNQYETFLNTKRSEISINSNIWLDTHIELKHEYLNFIEYYSLLQDNQIIYSQNLIDSRKEINEWINNNTHGRIADFLKENELSVQTRLIILNSLYFYSEWDNIFEIKRTHDNYFYTSVNDSVMVSYMHKFDNYAISENKEFMLIELPYFQRRSSMCILFPKNGLADFSIENLKNIYDTLITS